MSEMSRNMNQAANALAAKTVATMGGIQNKAMRKVFLRELLNRVGGGAEQQVGRALNSGASMSASLAQAYTMQLRASFERGARGEGRQGGLGRWKQDWAGLQGLGNTNTGGGSSSGGTDIDFDAMQEGIEQATEAIGAVDALIGAVGAAYGSLTDLWEGGDEEEEEAAPAVIHPTATFVRPHQFTPLTPEQIAVFQAQAAGVDVAGDTVGGGGGMPGVPTWALAGGAAVVAGVGYYLLVGRKGKKSKKV